MTAGPLRPATGRHGHGRLLRHPAGADLQRRRPHHDGGVRGDVIALGFLQTTIMEMGQPPAVSRPTRRCGSRAANTRAAS
ncbi:MAG: hypothetical protein WKF75_02035 [Singulisphaera sp.]